MSKNWPILINLYPETNSMSVSAVAAKAGLNKSVISRGFKELAQLDTNIVHIEREERKTGGRELKKASLTETGRKLVEAILSSSQETMKPVRVRIPDPENEEVRFLLRQTRSQSKEAQTAAWREITRLAATTCLWKSKEIWTFIDESISLQDPGASFGNAFNLLIRISQTVKDDPDSEKTVMEKIWNTFKDRFMAILESSSKVHSSRRWTVSTLLDEFMSVEAKFALFWKLWKKGVGTINDEKDYEEFKGPYSEYFSKSKYELKNSVKRELYDMMNSSDPKVRNRAASMHLMLVQ